MAKENTFMTSLQEQGLIDERQVAAVADIVCSNGMSGRAWIFLNGTSLRLYEMEGFSGWGALIETLELKQTRFIKGSSFILHTSMKLEFGGNIYTFTGFGQAKHIIESVKSSCGA